MIFWSYWGRQWSPPCCCFPRWRWRSPGRNELFDTVKDVEFGQSEHQGWLHWPEGERIGWVVHHIMSAVVSPVSVHELDVHKSLGSACGGCSGHQRSLFTGKTHWWVWQPWVAVVRLQNLNKSVDVSKKVAVQSDFVSNSSLDLSSFQ